MTLTIVSGAAPGVEQGAIEAAVNLALRWQGWASSESILTVPPVYRTGLQPTSATDPGMVRRLNIQGADGALVFSTSMVTAGVAAFVDRWTERMGRAFLHVTLNPAALRAPLPVEVVERVRAWIRDLPSGRVYVTGPSADDVPGIQGAVRDALIAILEPFAVDEVRQTTRALSLIEQAATVNALNRRAVERDIEAAVSVPTPLRIGDPDDHHEANMAALGFGPPGDRYRLGPATRADLEDLDAVPDPVDSAAPLHVHQTPPEGLDEVQRAQLDASIREADREIRDEPPAPGDQTA